MLSKVSALAVVPKARAMFSRHLTKTEYAELMRRRTVTELAQYLKSHPYFKDSLRHMPTIGLHRAQLESMLMQDIFEKYESLLRYDFARDSFSRFFVIECEVEQILDILRLASIDAEHDYIAKMPAFLQSKLSVDLLKLAKARDFKEVLKALEGTAYHKVLLPIYKNDPNLENLAMLERALLVYYYSEVLRLAKSCFSGTELKEVVSLFLQEAELYNIGLIFRIKAFFPNQYTADEVAELLLPFSYRVPPRRMQQLAAASGLNTLESTFRSFNLDKLYGFPDHNKPQSRELCYMYKRAIRLLHFTTSPSAALAAFVFYAKLERSNIINVIEGVRYGLPPEDIDKLLKY